MARQTTVWFTEEDWALIDYIQGQSGARTRADALRQAIRQMARQYDRGIIQRVKADMERRAQPPGDRRQEEANGG